MAELLKTINCPEEGCGAAIVVEIEQNEYPVCCLISCGYSITGRCAQNTTNTNYPDYPYIDNAFGGAFDRGGDEFDPWAY